jgi:hypothetical protein
MSCITYVGSRSRLFLWLGLGLGLGRGFCCAVCLRLLALWSPPLLTKNDYTSRSRLAAECMNDIRIDTTGK